jgi:ectoine hydroxylase-related dioxygenase (phytanoyl-CoA dioxygenase family)
MLGHFEPEDTEAIAAQIRRDGYYIFENAIPAALCDEFAKATMHIEARTSRASADRSKPRVKFDPANPVGYVYDLPEPEVWKVPSGQKMIADPVFVNVAQAYFRAAPSLKDLNVWWSAVMGGKPDSNSAQMFHFDYDATPIWLKFFIYVTDVTAETGPHVYVRGSHRMQQPRMREMLSRGYVRISDEEIEQVFGSQNVIELTGLKGTVIAVDTLGYHKGKAPQSGARLVAQLEFATPLFAKTVSEPVEIPRQLEPSLAATMRTYDWAFRRYRQDATPGQH